MAFADLIAQMDRAVQNNLGAVSMLYQPAIGSAVPVTGMFDAQYQLAKGGAEAGVGTLEPAVFLRVEDLPSDPEEDDPTLTIGGVQYRMIGPPQPDGMGGVLLVLRKRT